MEQMLQACKDATHATLKHMVASSIEQLALTFAVSENEVRSLWREGSSGSTDPERPELSLSSASEKPAQNPDGPESTHLDHETAPTELASVERPRTSSQTLPITLPVPTIRAQSPIVPIPTSIALPKTTRPLPEKELQLLVTRFITEGLDMPPDSTEICLSYMDYFTHVVRHRRQIVGWPDSLPLATTPAVYSFHLKRVYDAWQTGAIRWEALEDDEFAAYEQGLERMKAWQDERIPTGKKRRRHSTAESSKPPKSARLDDGGRSDPDAGNTKIILGHRLPRAFPFLPIHSPSAPIVSRVRLQYTENCRQKEIAHVDGEGEALEWTKTPERLRKNFPDGVDPAGLPTYPLPAIKQRARKYARAIQNPPHYRPFWDRTKQTWERIYISAFDR
ncbi:hypothetical protein C8J57DRAFT_1338918 [Mycena rebaudengoi]|nr:hypothetical protein C8J57DRAFT_1338918 [Mycena rebaudengoi]